MFEKNLKYYRLKKNMTKRELADACHITPMAITNYENGSRQPDIDTIKKLADALGVYVVDFLTSRNSKLQFQHCEFRKHSTLSKAKQEYIREAVEEYFCRFFDAVECLGGNPLPETPKAHTLNVSGDYEEDALKLRKYLGLQEEGPLNNLVGVLENKGILILELDIDDDHFSGMNGLVNEYPYIVINQNISPERKRTTIVHELAHQMFVWRDDSIDAEKEATAIAGSFLITKTDLFRELGLKKNGLTKDMILVCQEYGISSYLLVKRAAQVGIMSKNVEKEFYIKANSANWRKHEPSRVRITEKPLLFSQLVYRAINEEDVSINRGAELLKLPVSDVAKYVGLMEV